MTYSIVAVDKETGEIGVAVQSHYFAIGHYSPYAKALRNNNLCKLRSDLGQICAHLNRKKHRHSTAISRIFPLQMRTKMA